nr:hypothetical protein Iba_scaffold13492CG0190 [Ipomoea batatas]
MQPEGMAPDDGEARLPVVASSLLLSFFKATPLADGEAADDTAKGEDGGRERMADGEARLPGESSLLPLTL